MHKIDFNEYKEEHRGDLKTLIKIYWKNKPIWKSPFFWIAFALSIIIQVFLFVSKGTFYEAIKFVADNMLSVMPNILGFNLGGYVLLIGLNSQSILDEITEPTEGSKYSLFQMQSAVFAMSILIQTTSILLGYIYMGIIEIGECISVSYEIALLINSIGFLILNFISIYALVLIGQIVINIFNFGQILHFFVRLDRLEKEAKEEEKNK